MRRILCEEKEGWGCCEKCYVQYDEEFRIPQPSRLKDGTCVTFSCIKASSRLISLIIIQLKGIVYHVIQE